MLYGGAIDNCKLFGQDSHGSGEVFDKLVHIEDDNTTSSISSPPFRICPCINHHPDCSKLATKHLKEYPGNTFTVSVVAVGQRNGTFPAVRVSDRVFPVSLLSHFAYFRPKSSVSFNH